MKKTILLLAALFLSLACLCGCAGAGKTSETAGRTDPKTDAGGADTENLTCETAATETEPVPSSGETEPLTVPETTPVTEEKTIGVADQLDYRKNAVNSELSTEFGYDFSDFEHLVRLPAIIGTDSENAESFNRKIMEKYKDTVDLLSGGGEDNLLIRIDYSFGIGGGAAAILMTESVGVQIGGIGVGYSGFYYDTEADCELTFEQYLSKLGLSRRAAAVRLGATDGYAAYVDMIREMNPELGPLPLDPDQLAAGIFGEDGTSAVITTDYMMDDQYLLETGPIL